MDSQQIQDVVRHLEQWAPPAYQEEYDNSGLITGNSQWPVTGILTTLDCTENVIEEAMASRCNLIVAHHPIVFRGLKRLTGRNYVERAVIRAIKNDIAIYALHTNLDHVRTGVNHEIANRLGLVNARVLAPRPGTLAKLVTFVPRTHEGPVVDALHQAGAGQIGNYEYCSFRVAGQGYFRPNENANPHLGQRGELEQVDEIRIEIVFPRQNKDNVLAALRSSHPYEEVAYYYQLIDNGNPDVGAGLVGELPQPLEPKQFLTSLKNNMKTPVIRYTAPPPKAIERVAVCGGAGSFLLPRAIAEGAQVLVTADFKYHEFFDSEQKIMIADIGHYESERFTKELMAKVLKEKFPTFAVNFSKIDTNPISYF